MSRRVATITLNPAYDLVGFCPEIERGEVNLVRTTGLHAAGKGINVAKVLKDLGIDVTVGGFLGKDNQDGSIGTGIVLLTLRGNPAKNVFTLGIAYPASPVHGNIAPRRHSLMLHNPFNFV
jgi:hypothetical protein